MPHRSPADVLAAAYFPGPRSENEAFARSELTAVLDHWFDWRKGMAGEDPTLLAPGATADPLLVGARARLSSGLDELCEALTAEVATHTPHYVGHMKAELSLPALLGWFAAMLHNPNNTSRDASRVGTRIEAEAIGMLAGMIGYDPGKAEGHFTSGGTVANFEAVWRARYRLDHWLSMALLVAEKTGEPLDVFEAANMGWDRFGDLWREHGVDDAALRRCSAAASNPADVYRRLSKASGRDYLGPVVLVPGNKHYSWQKAANVFGLGEDSFWSAPLDDEGRLDIARFRDRVFEARDLGRPILMAVSVAGTTEAGEIDPIDRLHDLLEGWTLERGWRIWRHVDAAYGGFLCSLLGGVSEKVLSDGAKKALKALKRADSVTLDPHKLGYVPYACGAFLTRDTTRYAVSGFDAPYLDRPELGAGKWSSTLEGSRSAAGAAATWLTGRAIGFGPDRFGALLAETIRSRREFEAAVREALPVVRFLEPADSNIACFSVAHAGDSVSVSNTRTRAAFDALLEAGDFMVTRTTLGPDYAVQRARHAAGYGGVDDADGLLMVRCVFMNPYWAAPAVRRALIPQFVECLRKVIDAPDASEQGRAAA